MRFTLSRVALTGHKFGCTRLESVMSSRLNGVAGGAPSCTSLTGYIRKWPFCDKLDLGEILSAFGGHKACFRISRRAVAAVKWANKLM